MIKGAWTGPAALHLSPHALAPVAELPVREVVSAIHILADLTLGLGKVVHDYLRQPSRQALRISEMALATWASILSQGGLWRRPRCSMLMMRRSAVDVTAVPEPLKSTAWDYDRTWWVVPFTKHPWGDVASSPRLEPARGADRRRRRDASRSGVANCAAVVSSPISLHYQRHRRNPIFRP